MVRKDNDDARFIVQHTEYSRRTEARGHYFRSLEYVIDNWEHRSTRILHKTRRNIDGPDCCYCCHSIVFTLRALKAKLKATKHFGGGDESVDLLAIR